MYAAACRSSFSSMKSHIWPTGTWLGWSISLMFCSGFSQALAEQVCQSSFASSLTDCTGETIWIAITWQNVTYFKQRRVRNQDKKERGKTERSAAGVKSIPFLCCSLSPPHHRSRCLVDRDTLEPKRSSGKSGSAFYCSEKSFGCYCNPEQSAGHGI